MNCDTMLESGDTLNSILWLIVAAVSVVPLIVFLISYRRTKSRKLLITAAAFTLFFVKAVLLSMKLFIHNYADEVWWSAAAILDILIISLIAFALSRKA